MIRYILVRAITFFTVTLFWYFSFWWCAIPLTIWYAYQFKAYELVLLGFFIDVEFSFDIEKSYYTIGFLLLFISMQWLKPRLRNQNRL